jgi:hypothetical protein
VSAGPLSSLHALAPPDAATAYSMHVLRLLSSCANRPPAMRVWCRPAVRVWAVTTVLSVARTLQLHGCTAATQRTPPTSPAIAPAKQLLLQPLHLLQVGRVAAGAWQHPMGAALPLVRVAARRLPA